MRILIFFLAFCWGMQSVLAQEPKNLIVLRSENRHYVGDGQYQEYSDGDYEPKIFDSDKDQGIEYLWLHYSDPKKSTITWNFVFHMRAPGKNLVPGVYTIPLNETPRPDGISFLIGGNGIDFDSGKGCSGNWGSFTIFELEVDYKQSAPRLVKFAASFEHHCEGNEPALFGLILYQSTYPMFCVTINPILGLITSGQSTQLKVRVDPVNGFNSPVMLATAMKPQEGGLLYEPTTLQLFPGEEAEIKIYSTSATKRDVYEIIVVGTTPNLTTSASASLTVIPPQVPDYQVSVSPTELEITRKSKARVYLRINRQYSHDGPIIITASETKSWGGKITPSSFTTSGNFAEFEIATDKKSKPGSYQIQFSSVDIKGVMRNAHINITVN